MDGTPGCHKLPHRTKAGADGQGSKPLTKGIPMPATTRTVLPPTATLPTTRRWDESSLNSPHREGWPGSLGVVAWSYRKRGRLQVPRHRLSHPRPGQSQGSKYGRAEHAKTQVTPVHQIRSGVEPDHPLLPVAGGDPLTAQVAMQDQSRGGTVGGVQPANNQAAFKPFNACATTFRCLKTMHPLIVYRYLSHL